MSSSPRRLRASATRGASRPGLTPRLLEWAVDNPTAWRTSDEWTNAHRPLTRRRNSSVLGSPNKKKKPRISNMDWIQRLLDFIRVDDEELVIVEI